ncbi:dethiobiotin synthase [Leptolyngbya sp. FACHB-261]|uniref:dethiobiotin synthase n=1 Tax=Leptolyngbya sp. FACHB-261 TaxID=2692806 RepID=UPI0016856F19|nr:dethiobiotin synthase [Leptolyngbya sp. FACHB-261]MBD2101320.1 ATP-dependent dethiobiotin synthetase BioD [Leptolyngbya sp. FACHB-261]
MKSLLITATDTGAGKTVLTTALAAYWQTYAAPEKLGVFKPFQSGPGDCEHYQQVLGLSEDRDTITPQYFAAPLAPPLAAEQEGRSVDLAAVWRAFTALQTRKQKVLVEGVGGLGSPITRELVVADLARDWRLPTLLVVPVKLGAIGQAVANVALARHYGVDLRGIVLNLPPDSPEPALAEWAPPDLVSGITGVPILGILPALADPTDRTKLVQAASGLDLEQLGWHG